MKRFVGAALAAALAMGFASPAPAQSVYVDPANISACLCGQQAVSTLMQRVDAAQRTYDGDRAQIDALDEQIEQAKAHLDVDSQGQVDAVKAMNLQREQLYARTYDLDLPAVQAAIQDYNQAAGHYTARCAGRGLDPMGVAAVQPTLICPVLRLSQP